MESHEHSDTVSVCPPIKGGQGTPGDSLWGIGAALLCGMFVLAFALGICGMFVLAFALGIGLGIAVATPFAKVVVVVILLVLVAVVAFESGRAS